MNKPKQKIILNKVLKTPRKFNNKKDIKVQRFNKGKIKRYCIKSISTMKSQTKL